MRRKNRTKDFENDVPDTVLITICYGGDINPRLSFRCYAREGATSIQHNIEPRDQNFNVRRTVLNALNKYGHQVTRDCLRL